MHKILTEIFKNIISNNIIIQKKYIIYKLLIEMLNKTFYLL